MAVFEVTGEYLEEFVDAQIEKNQELKDFREDLIDILACRTSDLENSAFEDAENEDSWSFEKKEPTQLYVRDSRYHIRIKDLVVDFFEKVFMGTLLEAMLFWFGLNTLTKVSSIKITKEFILFVKRVIKEYIIKLDSTEFCVYLQIITHLKEHQEFSVSELKGWFPIDTESECNMYTEKWSCPNLKQGKCNFVGDKLEGILQKMVSKNIIEYAENNMYKIKY